MVTTQKIYQHFKYQYILPAINRFLIDHGYNKQRQGVYSNEAWRYITSHEDGLAILSNKICSEMGTTPERQYELYLQRKEDGKKKAASTRLKKKAEKEYNKKPWYEQEPNVENENPYSNMDYVNQELLRKYQFESILSPLVDKSLNEFLNSLRTL